MQDFGYKVVDAIVDHFETQDQKLPVATATRKEIDALFCEEAPENPMAADDVLKFVLENVMPNSNVITHPKAYAFVPGPSNYISVMSDTLATGFNIRTHVNLSLKPASDYF